jgi:hypothetical protein
MLTTRRIGLALTGLVVVLWVTVVGIVLSQTGAPPYRVLGSLMLIGLLWIAFALIALIWILVWFGGGLIAGLRGERPRPGSPKHRAARLDTRPPRA